MLFFQLPFLKAAELAQRRDGPGEKEENGSLIIEPVTIIPRGQAWFYSEHQHSASTTF